MSREQVQDGLVKMALLVRRLGLAVLSLWGAVARSVLQWGADVFSAASREQRLFFAANLLLLVAAVPGWTVYRSSLVEDGVGSVGSHWKLAFLVVPVLSVVCGLVAFSPRRIVFLCAHSLVGLLLVLGFVFPGTFHTDMIVRSDYSFAWSAYAYAVFWMAALLSGPRAISAAPLDGPWLQETLFAPRGNADFRSHAEN